MAIPSKYGVARHIYIPIIKRAVVDYAVGADWTPVAGDVKISKDGGAAANVTNLPTAIVMGNGAIWDFSLTTTEMQAAQINVTIVDAATKAVEDQGFIIETYGNASAQHAFDISSATPTVNATQWAGTTIPAPNVTGVPKVDLIDWLGSAPNALTSGRIDAIVNAIAAGVITETTMGADTSKYQAKVWMFDDTVGTIDRYVTAWFKNGEPVLSGITSPTIQVIKVTDGSDLIASTAMTQIASTGLYKYNETSSRVTAGAAFMAKVTASIDGSTRTFIQPIGRDS